MAYEIRHPKPDEDLTSIWPWTDTIKLNLDQVLICVSEAQIEAGIICWDAGHDMAYIGELESPTQNRFAVKALANHLMDWLKSRGLSCALMTSEEGNAIGNSCERLGARFIGYERVMVLPVKVMQWNPKHRWDRKIGG